MKINNLGYLFKEGIRSIFLHGFMSFAAVCVTVACLLIVGIFFSLMTNLNLMVKDLNQSNEILVFLDENLSDAEANSTHTWVGRVENVEDVKFVDKEVALKNFIAQQPNADAFEGLETDTLRHRLKVILTDYHLLDETKASILLVPGVDEISSADELASGFTMLEDVINIVSMVIIGVLLVVSLLIISNTVKLAMYDRKTEISIMKMVGATNGFIRLPFVVQGFLLGVFGAAVAFFLEWLMYDSLVNRINAMDTAGFFTLVPFTDPELLIPMVAMFAAAGMFVGILGSWTSIRKFMDV